MPPLPRPVRPAVSGIIEVDVLNGENTVTALRNMAKWVQRSVSYRTRKVLEEYVEILKHNAPDDKRVEHAGRPDLRHAKLNQSFEVKRLGPADYSVITMEPQKFLWVTRGTKGNYPIRPVFQKTLWWDALGKGPGLYFVIHPGIQHPNDFAVRSYMELQAKTQQVQGIADDIVKSFSIMEGGLGKEE